MLWVGIVPEKNEREKVAESDSWHAPRLGGGRGGMQIVVPCTALLAGSLDKRSEWMRSWNPRFVVLTTEALAWHREPTPGNHEEPKRRTVVLNSAMTFSVRDGSLHLSQPGCTSLCFRAASDEETQVWLETLRDVVGTLKAEGRAARWHALSCVKQLLTSAPPFLELPHIGSRNLRQRQLDKLFFTVRRHDEAEEEVLLYMMRLPEGAVAWASAEGHAFEELLEVLRLADHPFVMNHLHAELLPATNRVAVYRRYMPRGSLRDALHRAHAPRDPHGVKYSPQPTGYSSGDRGGSPASPGVAPTPQWASPADSRGAAGGSTPPGGDGGVGVGEGVGPWPLGEQTVASFGRQILEAMCFLQSVGLPCVHVHAGNVLLDGSGHCRLSEVELALLRAPSAGEQLAQPARADEPDEPRRGVAEAGSTTADVRLAGGWSIGGDVVAFGHLLFELLTGREFTEQELAHWRRALRLGVHTAGPPCTAAPAAWHVLRRIFVPEALEHMPALQDLPLAAETPQQMRRSAYSVSEQAQEPRAEHVPPW